MGPRLKLIELDTSWCSKSSTVTVKIPLINCIPEYHKKINIFIFNIPFKAFKNCDLLEIFFFQFRDVVFGGLKIERTWGVSLNRKGKQWVREYLLNSPIKHYVYVLY